MSSWLHCTAIEWIVRLHRFVCSLNWFRPRRTFREIFGCRRRLRQHHVEGADRQISRSLCRNDACLCQIRVVGLSERLAHSCLVSQRGVLGYSTCAWLSVATRSHWETDHVELDECEGADWHRADWIASDVTCKLSVGTVLCKQMCTLLRSTGNLQRLGWGVCFTQEDGQSWSREVAAADLILLVRFIIMVEQPAGKQI